MSRFTEPRVVARRIVEEVLIDAAGDRSRPPATSLEEHARAELAARRAAYLAAIENHGRALGRQWDLMRRAAEQATEYVNALARGIAAELSDRQETR